MHYNGPAPEGRCKQHFYTVFYGLMMFYFFYFEMLLHIRSITVLLMYQLEKAFHTVTPISVTMFLWPVSFLILSQTFDVSSVCCFLFPVKSGVFFLNSLKMSNWHMRPSFSFPWNTWEFLISSADTWYYNIHCDVVHCLFNSSKLDVCGEFLPVPPRTCL